jgi:hypothetical protein
MNGIGAHTGQTYIQTFIFIYIDTELITKDLKAAPSLQQLYKELCDIEEVAKYTPPSAGESEEWAAIVSSAEDNRILQILSAVNYYSQQCMAHIQ